MFSTVFLIAAWLTITPMPQTTDTTSVFLCEFSRIMSNEGLLDTANYELTDEAMREYLVYDVDVVYVLDGDSVLYTTLVALTTEKVYPARLYTITVTNVTDENSNPIEGKNSDTQYFKGFVPNKYEAPNVRMRK